ncbi:dihydroorotate dehydrogenase [Desulfatitalea alkaliphila]|uniref:Dihydroorotate dehydrogenase n=1 Tax=Desulfatitalea alkaliphila TaxID=2929485 RepID=A0AA41R1X1_9BACT|nr:dihydroorotate dehydrogenase [Desulfatitalea alkaliphila]MCJ8500617.1 dihydroorotate dehydrogenase [Desulfatitalea alkaliphila]
MTNVDLSVAIGPLKLQNPVMTASGTFGYAKEFDALVDLNRLGAIVVKGLSLLPAKGNPPPRIVETPCGMLNAIGLENVGVEAFVRDKLPFLRRLQTPVLANIYGTDVQAYAELAARLSEIEGVAGVEVNISCPNVKEGGVAFGADPRTAQQVTEAVRVRYKGPVVVKLSPNVSDITVIARAVADGGADAVSLINTITGMAIDINTRRPKLANITGGLSGPAIKPVALRMVWQVARAVKLPIIGIGGIMNAEDALAFIIAGAGAVQIGTGNFVNPGCTMQIVDGIADYLLAHGMTRVRDLIGTLQVD